MEDHPKDVPATSDVVRPAVDGSSKFQPPSVWEHPELGLRKQLISFSFHSIDHPTELSECLVRFEDVLGLGNRESNYLSQPGEEQLVQMGSGETAVDFLIDRVVQQMYAGESSRINILTQGGDTIEFTLTLIEIRSSGYLYQLSPKEMLHWALAQKNHGVAMFKKWPAMAQRYFNQAAKGLISFKPFDVVTVEKDGISGEELYDLHDVVCLNVAACLLKERRYEDVLHVLQDATERTSDGVAGRLVSEKAVYRRALAHFHLKQLDEARTQIERINYSQNREQLALWKDIVKEQTVYQGNYARMVRKMFD